VEIVPSSDACGGPLVDNRETRRWLERGCRVLVVDTQGEDDAEDAEQEREREGCVERQQLGLRGWCGSPQTAAGVDGGGLRQDRGQHRHAERCCHLAIGAEQRRRMPGFL
jgi:hypothetical protein